MSIYVWDKFDQRSEYKGSRNSDQTATLNDGGPLADPIKDMRMKVYDHGEIVVELTGRVVYEIIKTAVLQTNSFHAKEIKEAIEQRLENERHKSN